MHHTHLEAIQVVQKLSYRLDKKDYDKCDVVVYPGFTALRSVQTTIDSDRIPIALGAQNVYPEDKGAFTGEVSPPMLAKLNVRYVIVGHSERREIFGETDDFVSRKVRAVLGAGMDPILCVGETLDEREAGETQAKGQRQVTAGFAGGGQADAGSFVAAYEPIWAIGTGKTASAEEANATIGTIRATIRQVVGDTADRIRVLYGGSVKPGNAAELMAQPEIDGALVGAACLEPDDFARIIQYGR